MRGAGHQEGGRPGACRARCRAEPGRGRDRPVGRRAFGGVLRSPAGGPRQRHGLPHVHPVAAAAVGCAEGRAPRQRRPGPRPLPQPLRPRALVLRQLRRRHPVPGSAARPDRVRRAARALRGLHARCAVPGLQGRTAQAGGPRGHPPAPRSGRAVDRRGVGDVGGRVLGVPRGHGARRPPDDDRGRDPQGGAGPAGVPARRGAALPVAVARRRVAVRGRGAAHPAGHPDRLRPGRGALRARRAVHRAAPARQPQAHPDPGPAARSGQHADRRRARRGHDPVGRLDRRHRPRRGRARRSHRAQRHRRGAGDPPGRRSPAPTCPGGVRSRCPTSAGRSTGSGS